MNRALKGLLFKEWKMMKGFLIGMIVLALIIFLLISYDSQSAMKGFVALLGFGFIIVPASVLFSLNTEANQLQSFLHNPQSAKKLLTTKLIYSTCIAAFFLLIVTIGITVLELIKDISPLSGFEVFSYILITAFFLFTISFYPTALIFLFWTLNQIWRTYVGGLSIIFVVVLFIAGNRVLTMFRETYFYSQLTQWGNLPFAKMELQFMEFEGFLGEIPFGSYVFHGIIAIVFYVISIFLLDRKVEV